MVRILHDDWSLRFGENTSDQTLRHLTAMLSVSIHFSLDKTANHWIHASEISSVLTHVNALVLSVLTV